MSAWRWELRRKRDGQHVDYASRLWILCRASVPVMIHLGLNKSLTYEAVHIATGTVVGQIVCHDAWEIDTELVATLEPGEARP